MIDNYLNEFLSPKARRKVYAAAALLQTLAAVCAGAVASSPELQKHLDSWPLLVTVLAAAGAVIALLAKANVNEGEDGESYVPKHKK